MSGASAVRLAAPRVPGTLIRRVGLRVLEISPTGCLIESSQPLVSGVVGELRVVIDEQEYVDAVRICRVTKVAGSGLGYRAGAEFLRVTPSSQTSLQNLARRLAPLD
jgi:hypothetical protein